MTVARVTNEELASSLDEIWMIVSEQAATIERINARLDRRDEMNRILLAHVERLAKEKHALMVHLGYKYLEAHPSVVRGGAGAVKAFASG